MRSENGGRRSKTVSFIRMLMTLVIGATFNDDQKVLDDLKTETLARRLSQCRVDAVALDGMDRLHEIVINASPDVQVILLDWRSYESWSNSIPRQMVGQTFWCVF